MIALQRPNGKPILVNADLIETVESGEEGATVVTLTTGNALVVTDSPERIRASVIEFRRSIGAAK